MPELVLDCPHCGAERIGFSYGGVHPERLDDPIRGYTWNTLFVCRHCKEGVVVRLATRQSNSETHFTKYSGDPRSRGVEIAEIHPKATSIDAPEDVPAGISKNFREAVDSLRRRKFDSAGMMFRRVLDRSTLAISEDAESMRKKNLKRRIEILADQQKLTPDLKGLAHLLRLEGNDAAHDDEEFDETRAKQMGEFAELFLIYAFTLPERVRRAHDKTSVE